MAQTTPFLALITPLGSDRPDRPVDPGWGVPDLPGTGPGLGGPHPAHPIFIPIPPGGETKPPPDAVWPPLAPPGTPTVPGHILVWIPGYGYRWINVGVPPKPSPAPGPEPVPQTS
jgi:hypothetical protein